MWPLFTSFVRSNVFTYNDTKQQSVNNKSFVNSFNSSLTNYEENHMHVQPSYTRHHEMHQRYLFLCFHSFMFVTCCSCFVDHITRHYYIVQRRINGKGTISAMCVTTSRGQQWTVIIHAFLYNITSFQWEFILKLKHLHSYRL